MSLGRFDYLEIGQRRQAVERPQQSVAVVSSRTRFVAKEVIGRPGRELGEFCSPGGLALDRAGNLYVADTYNHRIQKITPQGDVYGYSGRGSGPGSLLLPQGVVVDTLGCIYVIEQGNARLQKFTPEGKLLLCLGGRSEFTSPAGICMDDMHNLYIADCGAGDVKSFTAEGRRRWDFVVRRTEGLRLKGPQGVACDLHRSVFVADTLGNRIVTLDLTGKPIASFGQHGVGRGDLAMPQDLGVDVDGGLLVVEVGNHRLQKLSSEGESLAVFPDGRSKVRLNSPSGVVVDGSGVVYLADTLNHRILVLHAE